MNGSASQPAPLIERDDWWKANTRRKERPRLPRSRPLRKPDGPCRVCDRPATRFKADTPLCDLHFVAVNDLVNYGRTAAVATMKADPEAATREAMTLRQKLKARYADAWNGNH